MDRKILNKKNRTVFFAIVIIFSLLISVLNLPLFFTDAADAEIINYPALNYYPEGSSPDTESPWSCYIRSFENSSAFPLIAGQISGNTITEAETGIGYSVFNSKTARRIVFNSVLNSAEKYGAHFRFTSKQDSFYDFGGNIEVIGNKSATAATVYYRLIKIDAYGRKAVISENGRWLSFRVTGSNMNPCVDFPVSQAHLTAGESVAVEIYAVSNENAVLAISIGNPTATTVCHQQYYKGTITDYKYTDYCDNLLFNAEGSNIGCHTSLNNRWNTRIFTKDSDAVSYYKIDTMRAQWSIIYSNIVGMAGAVYYYTNNKIQVKTADTGVAFQFVSPEKGTAQVNLPIASSTENMFVRILAEGKQIYPSQGGWEALSKTSSVISASCPVNKNGIISVEIYGSQPLAFCSINGSASVSLDAESYYTATDDVYNMLDSEAYESFTDMSGETGFDTKTDENKTISQTTAEFMDFLGSYVNQKTLCNYVLWGFNGNQENFSATGGSSITQNDSFIRYTGTKNDALLSPEGLKIPASKITVLELKIKSFYNAAAVVYWDNGKGFNREQSSEFYITDDEQYHTFRIELSGNSSWYGYINRISVAFDTIYPVEIDSIAFFGNSVNVTVPLSGSFRKDVYSLLSVKKDLMQNSNIFKVGFTADIEYLSDTDAAGNYTPGTVHSIEYLAKLAEQTDMPVTLHITQGAAENDVYNDSYYAWNPDNTVCRVTNGSYNSFSLANTALDGSQAAGLSLTQTLLERCAQSISADIIAYSGYVTAVKTDFPDNAFILDYNPDNIREFRDYARNIYGTIAAFNTKFNTDFSTFELKSTDYNASTVENIKGFDSPRTEENADFYALWTAFCKEQQEKIIKKNIEILKENIDYSMVYINQADELLFDYSDSNALKEIEEYVKTYSNEITAGDANADYSIDIRDMVRSKKYCANPSVDNNISFFDMDNNRTIDARDLILLRAMLLRL